MQDVEKLLDYLKPTNYKLHIRIDEEQTAFEGRCTITATANQDLNEIKLHSKDLMIDSAELTLEGETFSVDNITYNEQAQLAILTPKDAIKADTEFEIHLNYHATITDTMHGIYPANYEEEGEKKTIISTQFESHHAREAFPCIDEPAAKAEFSLTITANDQEFVSNTQADSVEVESGRKTVVFAPTPVMSTYLLAFAIGDLGFIEAKTKRGVKVRAFAPKAHTEHLTFALDTATRCFDFYEEYFDYNYPLDTCDLIAIPEFAAGAMENWGCVTFRETALLVDENNSSLANKQWVALVVAHELAHQWFGNLVTMQWWDDLWLNEGFASWIEYMAVDSLFPEWEMWTNFIADDYSSALQLDALDSSHPIRVHVHDPRDINEIFDSITYRKGASIIRMLHNHVGAEAFKQGLREYMQTHAYSNATTEDLWKSLTTQTHIDVVDFMESWTMKTGYPQVNVTSSDNGWKVSQQRFYLHPAKNGDDTTWHIPLLPIGTDDEHALLSQETMILEDANQSLIKLNRNQSGLYRVSYPSEHYIKLSHLLENGDLSTPDRMGILDDAFELAKAGAVPTTDALTLLEGYANEKRYPSWENIAGELGHIRSVLLTSEHESLLAPLVEKLISEQYSHLGWESKEGESDNDTLTRPIVLGLAMRFELFDAPAKAKKLMQGLLEHDTPVPADIRGAVYGFNARHGDETLYEQLLEAYHQTQLQEEKQRFARALTSFREQKLIERSLSLIQSDAVRQQDVISWLAGLFGNEFSRPLAWEWYKANWVWLEGTFKDGHIYSYLALILGAFTEMNKVDEIRSFFNDKNTNGLSRSLEQAIERIEYQAHWQERDAQSVIAHLR